MATINVLSAKDRAEIVSVVTTVVAKAMHVTPARILANTRVPEVVAPRMFCGWMLVKHYRFTLEQAAAGLNRSDHGSAIHWRNEVDKLIEDNPVDAARLHHLVRKCDEVLADLHSRRQAVLDLAESSPDVLTTSIMRIKDPERLEHLKTLIVGRLAVMCEG